MPKRREWGLSGFEGENRAAGQPAPAAAGAVQEIPAPSWQIALIGNPNTGKTSLFNHLTGLRQRVANYPGITVEKKTGLLRYQEMEARVIDLPGTYSLSASSPDERIVVDVLCGRVSGMAPPDLVVCVIEAANVRRNLYLASQVAELGLPMVIVLNLYDEARKRGLAIDCRELSRRLGVPVVPTVAKKGEGLEELRRAIAAALRERPEMAKIKWPGAVEQALEELRREIEKDTGASPRKAELERVLFDCHSAVLDRYGQARDKAEAVLEKARSLLRQAGYNPLAAEPLLQYEHLDRLTEGIVAPEKETAAGASGSIDRVLLHRGWGMAVFAGMMYVVFQVVYTGAGPFMTFIERGKGLLQQTAAARLAGAPLAQSLVADGMIEGIGAFVIFLPQILILFFFIALLEDTGYMARAAFLMDKLFSWCGLSGRSFVPLLSCYACCVPGVMACRTIAEPRARLATMLIAPLMSCSARLPIYVLLIGAFIEPAYGSFWAGFALFAMHFVGLAVAVPVAWLLGRMLKTRAQPFILELPPYRTPDLRNVFFRMWERGRAFVRTAGTVIFIMTVIVWALLYFPRPPELARQVKEEFAAEARERGMDPAEISARLDDPGSGLSSGLAARIDRAYLKQSYLGRAGQVLQPVFDPAGFDWKITAGVAASFPAREVIIPTLGVIYSLGREVDETSGSLRQAMKADRWADGPRAGRPLFNLPAVIALLVFYALCQQCGPTLITIARESRWRWALFSFVYMTLLAWGAAVLCYQVAAFF